MHLRSILLATAAVLSFAAGCSPKPDAPIPVAEAPAEVKTINLPADITYPEGIAFDEAAGVFYTAGAADGAVTKVELATGVAAPVAAAGVLFPASSAAFPAVLGMKFDEGKRLWLAGGRTGLLHVLDTATGKVVKTLKTPAGGLINDVTLTPDAAYFSDSFRPVIWKVSRVGGQIGEAEKWLDIGKVVVHGEGANINGIAATADGKTLLLVQMNKGLLFKVDIPNKAITPVDLKGQTLEGADGLVLGHKFITGGQELHVVLQPHGEIVAIHLSEDFNSGTVTGRLKSDKLAWPATAFRTTDGIVDKLVVVNTQFDKRGDNAPTTPFTVADVPISLINSFPPPLFKNDSTGVVSRTPQ